ncbi:PREDICTED: fatty acyl-CoA reductase 1-like [Ceratosolen solmsi marchali]|uniref:Fatty acyl-CoA reductase n=1 Tax=Ceratosolen solmsi marchali TaxID=326594 RepID=A0AAJ7DYJ3_9HYME|nr:PREDICTED: fatty acyl-CoA reductase 1-like [Ceratosolen solmsi marchali]
MFFQSLIMPLQEWYGNREILLTGVTSELGRNLLEKLLRCFPNIKVHLVLRSRRGLYTLQRVKEQIYNSPGYDRLRQEQPDAISRVVAYEGNLVYDNLGIRRQDHEAMANVTVVFHAAGPFECLLKFCSQLPKLHTVVMASDLLSCNEHQVIEHTVYESVPNGLPLGIVRLPSLGPAYREPMPGYVELLKGATAVMVGAGYLRGRKDLPVEIIPRDIATNTFIAAAWDVANRGTLEVPMVYNAATIKCSWGELIRKADRANRNFRYPTFRVRGMTTSHILRWIIVLIFEWLPSIICDFILGICYQKQNIVAEHKRVRSILKDFESVTLKVLTTQRQNIYNLQSLLSSEEKELFCLHAQMDIEAYILCAAAATRKYCVDDSNLRIVSFFTPTLLALFFLICGYYFIR